MHINIFIFPQFFYFQYNFLKKHNYQIQIKSFHQVIFHNLQNFNSNKLLINNTKFKL